MGGERGYQILGQNEQFAPWEKALLAGAA